MNNASPARPRRLGLILPWAAFIALALGWVIYWNLLAHFAQTRLNEAIARERAAGAAISIAETRTRGFPLQLALELRDAAYAPAGRAFRITTPRLVAHINVLNPNHLILALPSPLDITRSDATSRITGGDFLISARLEHGALARASLEANGLRIDDLAEPGDGLVFGRALLHLRPDARTPGAYQLAANFTDIVLPAPVRAFEPLGKTIAVLNAAIVLDQAAALAHAARGDALGPWTAQGGQARLETLELSWGAARGAGEGAVSVDSERRQQGQVTLRLSNPADTLRALTASPTLSNDAKRALQIAALAYALSGDDIELPLRAEGGALYLGPARLRDLPPLYRAP